MAKEKYLLAGGEVRHFVAKMKLGSEDIAVFQAGKTRALHHPNKSYLTSIQIVTGVGSSSEDKKNMGMAHILEHMFFKGSNKRPAPTAISRAANDIGAKMNAYTTYDHTVYYIKVLNDVFEEGFDLLADMYSNPLFPQAEFAKELNPILSELREQEDDPDSYLMERALQKFYGTQYHPIIGTKETIENATVEMMHHFKNRFYGGENCLVSVVGGVERSRMENMVQQFFADGHSAEKPEEREVAPQGGELLLEKAGIQEAYYNLLFPALPPEDPDRYKQDMMNYLLGGNESALLFERIREELGMSCYGIYSWVMRYKPFHILGINCGIAKEQLGQLHREVNDQIKRICDSPLEEERLQRGKASLRASIAARAETSSGLNSMIALPIMRGEKQNPVGRALEELEKISRQDIMEMARKTLSGQMLKAELIPA